MAVTAQFVGEDGIWNTNDDVYNADLNATPAIISFDSSPVTGQRGSRDLVRGFLSIHSGGANFVYADGSTHFYSQDADRESYINRSSIQSGRVQTE